MADYTQFNLRGDTKSNWLNANPVLSDREIALETDTQRFKIGNGTSYYNQLPYGRNTGEYLNFYNVTALAPLTVGNYYTHETAILAVPSSERAKGTIVSYETASGVWQTERFIGSDVASWSVLANWEKVPDASDIAQLRSDLNESTSSKKTLNGVCLIIDDNIGKTIDINGSNSYTIYGNNIFDQSSKIQNKIKNELGVEISDATSSYFSRYIAIPYGWRTRHLMSNFQMQCAYLYDANLNFLGVKTIFSDDVFIPEKKSQEDVCFIQIQVSNAAITNSMMVIYDNNFVTDTPIYESFIYNKIGQAYIGRMYVFDDNYKPISATYKSNKPQRDYLLISTIDSTMADISDVVVTHPTGSAPIHDEAINMAIKSTNKNKIVFSNDSIFYLAAPIVTPRDNLTFESDGAVFTTETAGLYSLLDSAQSGTNAVKIGALSARRFSKGSYIEISEGSNWDTAYIDYFDGDYVYLSKQLTKSYTLSAKVRNVSGAFEAKSVLGVRYRGLNIDWNYPNNSISPETTWAQNGITISLGIETDAAYANDHFNESGFAEISDCVIKNGGRHGILVRYSKACVIKNNICHGWGEHGIDIAFEASTNPPNQGHIIQGNTCYDNYYNGIQLHGASGCVVSSNICYNNSTGIGSLENANNNIFKSNIIHSNTSRGIALYNGANNCIISNNKIFLNGEAIAVFYTKAINIIGNNIHNNGGVGKYSIVINGDTSNNLYAGLSIISNNIFNDNFGAGCIYLALANRYIIDGNIHKTAAADYDFCYLHFSKGGKISNNLISNCRYICNGGDRTIVDNNVYDGLLSIFNNKGAYSIERNNDQLQYID